MAALARCPEPCLAELLLVGPLSASQSVYLVGGLAAAMGALYEAGLVARDLTPHHVHLDPHLGGVLRDGAMPLNLVEPPVLDADEHLAYRSPEQIESKSIDLRSNVYSLGALLYAALVGGPPFGGTWSHVYVSHLAEARPRPSERRGDLPPAIDTVVARALAVSPADRYDRPADLARAAATALDVALNGELVAPSEAEPAEQPAPEPADSQAAKPVPASEGAPSANGTGARKRSPAAKRAPTRARKRKSSTPDRSGPASRPPPAKDPKRRSKAVPGANGKPAATNGKPAATNGKPAAANGKPSVKRDRSRAKRRNAETNRMPRNGTPVPEDVNGLATEAPRSAPAANGNGPAANGRAPTQPRSVDDGRTTTLMAPVATGYAIPTRNGSGGHVVAALASATTVVRLKPVLRPRRNGSSACPVPVPVAAQTLKRSSRKGVLLVLGAAGLAAAAVATVGMTGDDENRDTRVASNDLSIRMPAGWDRVAPPARRLEWLSSTLGAASPDGTGRALVSGLIREPATARRALRKLLPAGASAKTVRLGRFEAKRYSNLTLGTGLTGTAYVIHTTGPSIALICRGRETVARQCAQAAATVTLRGERPVPATIAGRRARLVRAAVRTLSAERAAGRLQVAQALVAHDQARASRGLQASYLKAAGRVDLTGAYGQRIKALSAALHDASYGYGALADSINDGDQRAYDAARAVVLEAETQVWGKSAAN